LTDKLGIYSKQFLFGGYSFGLLKGVPKARLQYDSMYFLYNLLQYTFL